MFTIHPDGTAAACPVDIPHGDPAEGAVGFAQGHGGAPDFTFGPADPTDQATGFFVELQGEDPILGSVFLTAFGHRVTEDCGDGLNVNEWERTHCAS